MDFSFFNNPSISFITDNQQWLDQLPPTIVAVAALILSGFTFFKTWFKMNKTEQIKFVHEIQIVYMDLFEKYRNSVIQSGHNNLDDDVINNYLALLDPLEWYSFLRRKDQLGAEFDTIFATYFKAVYFAYKIHKASVNIESYPNLKNMWNNLKLSY